MKKQSSPAMVRLPKETLERIRLFAQAKDTTVSTVIRKCVRLAFPIIETEWEENADFQLVPLTLHRDPKK